MPSHLEKTDGHTCGRSVGRSEEYRFVPLKAILRLQTHDKAAPFHYFAFLYIACSCDSFAFSLAWFLGRSLGGTVHRQACNGDGGRHAKLCALSDAMQ